MRWESPLSHIAREDQANKQGNTNKGQCSHYCPDQGIWKCYHSITPFFGRAAEAALPLFSYFLRSVNLRPSIRPRESVCTGCGIVCRSGFEGQLEAGAIGEQEVAGIAVIIPRFARIPRHPSILGGNHMEFVSVYHNSTVGGRFLSVTDNSDCFVFGFQLLKHNKKPSYNKARSHT